MKQNFGKKAVLLIHWLMSLVLCGAMVALFFMNALPVKAHGVMVIAFAITALIVYLIFALGALLCIFPGLNRWKRRNFVTISATGLGCTRISVSAVNQVINQAISGTTGIDDLKIGIVNNDDNIEIDIDFTVEDGVHIPTVTSAIQAAVREFVESKCGVEVKNVVVSVHSIKMNEAEGDKQADEAGETAAQVADESLNVPESDETVEPEAADEGSAEVEEEAAIADSAEPIATEEAEDVEAEAEPIATEADDVEVEAEPIATEADDVEVEAGSTVTAEEHAVPEETAQEPETGTGEPAPGQGISRSAKRRRRRKKKLLAKMQAQQQATADSTELNSDDAEAGLEEAEFDTEAADAEPEETEFDTEAADVELEEAEPDSEDAEAGVEELDFDAEAAEAESEEAEPDSEPVTAEPDDIAPEDEAEETVDAAEYAVPETKEFEAESEHEVSADEAGTEFEADVEARNPDAWDVQDFDDGDATVRLFDDDGNFAYANEADSESEGYGDLSDAADTEPAVYDDTDVKPDFTTDEEFPDAGYGDTTLYLDEDEAPADYEYEDPGQPDDDSTAY